MYISVNSNYEDVSSGIMKEFKKKTSVKHKLSKCQTEPNFLRLLFISFIDYRLSLIVTPCLSVIFTVFYLTSAIFLPFFKHIHC